jgi:hypothetical protein
MGEFNYKKFLTENKLTYASKEVAKTKSPSTNFINIITEVWVENILEERNILKENLDENFLKNLYNKVKGKVKGISPEKLKGVEDNIKNAGYDSKDVLKDASKVSKDLPKDTNLTPDVLAKIRQLGGINIQTEAKKDQEEEPKGENKGKISTIEDLKSLSKTQPDTFTWEGKNDPEAEWNGQVIHNDEEEAINYIYDYKDAAEKTEKKTGLIKGKTYEVIPEFKEEGFASQPAYLITTEVKDEVSKGEGFKGVYKSISQLFSKYPKLMKAGKVAFGILGIGSVAAGLTGDTVIDSGAALADLPDALDDAGSDIEDAGVDQADADSGDTGNVTTIPTTADNSTDDSTVDKVQQSYDANNVDIGDTNLDNTDTNSSAVQTYDVGEYELDSDQKTKIVKDLVNQALEDLNGQLEDLKGKNVTSINLDIDFGGTISNQGDGGASNNASGGGDLLDGRSSTAEDISKQAGDQLTKIIQNTLGDNVEVNIDYNSVDTHSSYGDQGTQKAVDDLGTQSSFETVSVGDIGSEDIPKDEPQETPPDLMYQYLYDKPSPKKPKNPKGDNYKPDLKLPPEKIKQIGDKPKEIGGKKPLELGPGSPEEPKKDPIALIKSGEFGDLNRNNQIATILKTIKDDLNIYDKLGESGLEDIRLTGDLKQIIQNEKASEELKKLAKLIIAIRKNPNGFLNKISSATGVELNARQKAFVSKPGTKEKGMFRQGSTNENKIIHPFNELLLEGLIDDLITPADILNKKFEILALVGSMYASTTQKNDSRLSIVDPEKLSSEERKKLKGLGFNSTVSGDYYFLDDEGKTSTESGEEEKNEKPKPGEEVKATKVNTPKDSKEKPTSSVDFDAKDKSKTPQSAKALEKMGAKKDLTTALSRIDNRPELEGLIKSMMTYITIDKDDKVLALKTAKTRFTPLKDQPKYTSTSTSGAKVNYNLKEHIIRLIGLISEAEEKQRPDVEKSIKILDKYADLKSYLDRLSSKEMAIEFILGVMKFVGDNLKAKSPDMKTALSNVTRDLEKNPNTSDIANQLKAETLIRKKIKSLIKEQVRKILKEDTAENPKPEELIPARVKSNGKDALALTRPDGAPYAIAHPDISSLSKMFLNGKQDDTALCGWVQKKIKEPDFIEDLMENKLSLNEASEIDPKTIKKLNNCPLK